ncbi:MAG: RHS repeat-associated core domain-containing protein [Desulfobacteraceae bacterium]|nr:RHS repeat-associated core domain-containing protein [Desulfobacteraceae bacterium]
MIDRISINGTETLFYYDGDNKRIKKTQGQSSTLYFGENFEVVNGSSTLYIFAGTLRVAQLTDTGLKYFHKDHLGSTNALSGEDGTVIDFGEYLPYGLDQSPNALLNFTAYKFTDQEQDEGTGLYNYDARLYDPVLGQFIMADSMVPDIYNPQNLNRYAYCLNNPLIYVDPSGHIPAGDGTSRGTPGSPGSSTGSGRSAIGGGSGDRRGRGKDVGQKTIPNIKSSEKELLRKTKKGKEDETYGTPVKVHGNWCGPNWTAGQNESWDQFSKEEKTEIMQAVKTKNFDKGAPRDATDISCMNHDIKYGNARDNCKSALNVSKCEKDAFNKADYELAGALLKAGWTDKSIKALVMSPAFVLQPGFRNRGFDDEGSYYQLRWRF